MINWPKEKIKICIELTVAALARRNNFIDINSIPLDDRKTLQLYRDGNIKYVWNITSGAAEQFSQIKNLTFDDLVNIPVLKTPGKKHLLETYIKSRNRLKQVTYLHPLLKPILNHTQGLILFYEQFLEIFKQFGNFSYGQVLLLMNQLSTNGLRIQDSITLRFIENAQKNHGLSDRTMNGLLKLIAESFILVPRLHHVTEFTLIGYQTAYLKTYYPKEYVKVFKEYFSESYALQDFGYLVSCSQACLNKPLSKV